MKLSKLLILCLFLSLKGIAQTTITSNVPINQNWITNNSTGPWTISGSNVTVTFTGNLVLNNANQYFIITGSNVTIDGAGKTVTLNGITNYGGFVDASSTDASSLIKNIGLITTGITSLSDSEGYISKRENKATISNCFSTGEISNPGSNGIAGVNNFGTINNCYSTGVISGQDAGGITSFNFGTINNCYSTGDITGVNAGGIVGIFNLGNIQNCYSTGDISGRAAGGITCLNLVGDVFGFPSDGNISNCYTSGEIIGVVEAYLVTGGIAAYNLSTITNSRTSGTLSNTNSVGIALNELADSELSGFIGTISNSTNVTPTIANEWDNTIANQALTGEDGTIWNTSVSPYTLMPFILSELIITTPSATLTSNCAGVPSAHTTFGVAGSGLTTPVIISAPSNFEISTSSSGAYSSSLTLPQASTVSQTLYIRLSSSTTTNGANGTITANSSDLTPATTTVSSTTVAAPLFAVTGPYTVCSEGTYAVSLTVANSYNGWSASSNAITVNSAGYVTAGTVTGTYTVSYTDGCAQTASATVTVSSTSNLPAITDGLASYKFNNNPQGPLGSGNVIYMGYNGFNYSSTIRPTNTGFYRANNVSGSSAGSPIEFYIFRCTTCGTVSEYATRPQGTLSGNTSGTGQLTYTSSNGGGPFTIVYQATGGSPVTVNNISSTVAFNVVTPTTTTSYKLISVTDEITKATTDFSGTSASITGTFPHYIGESYGGGIVFYVDRSGQHGLIAATSNQSTGIKWWNGSYTTTGATATAIGSGLSNTTSIINSQGGTPTNYAAGLARAFNGGGHTDWYLPSKVELYLMYTNIGKGAGASSPNYNIGLFADEYYWSSSEESSENAWIQGFNFGFQYDTYKETLYYVRAIRSF